MISFLRDCFDVLIFCRIISEQDRPALLYASFFDGLVAFSFVDLNPVLNSRPFVLHH